MVGRKKIYPDIEIGYSTEYYTVIAETENPYQFHGDKYYKCRCICGETFITSKSRIHRNKPKGCPICARKVGKEKRSQTTQHNQHRIG